MSSRWGLVVAAVLVLSGGGRLATAEDSPDDPPQQEGGESVPELTTGTVASIQPKTNSFRLKLPGIDDELTICWEKETRFRLIRAGGGTADGSYRDLTVGGVVKVAAEKRAGKLVASLVQITQSARRRRA